MAALLQNKRNNNTTFKTLLVLQTIISVSDRFECPYRVAQQDTKAGEQIQDILQTFCQELNHQVKAEGNASFRCRRLIIAEEQQTFHCGPVITLLLRSQRKYIYRFCEFKSDESQIFTYM